MQKVVSATSWRDMEVTLNYELKHGWRVVRLYAQPDKVYVSATAETDNQWVDIVRHVAVLDNARSDRRKSRGLQKPSSAL